MEQVHSIRAVAHRTGLSQHVIRIWERRYGAVKPSRTKTNRRTYAETDVQRLLLLRQATQHGHGISHIAGLPLEKLRKLALVENLPGDVGHARPPANADKSALVEAAIDAVIHLDAARLETVLNRAALALGQQGFLQQLIVPLVQRIGDEWQAGKLRAAHEHAATAVIRSFLGNFSRPYQTTAGAPRLLVTTPAGQLHELGAVLVAATANNQGWQVTYLGPSLPADEIASAAVQSKVRAVALSIVYPEDDAHLPQELKRLRELLPPEIALLVGGRAAHGYQPTLTEIGAVVSQSLTDLSAALERTRRVKTKKL